MPNTSMYDTLKYEDYCPDKNHCYRPKEHIVCIEHEKPYVEPQLRCANFSNVDYNAAQVERLLHMLNELRIEVANGKAQTDYGELPKGYGLIRLRWDRELAAIAKLQNWRCEEKTSNGCAATGKFKDPQDFRLGANVKVPKMDLLSQTYSYLYKLDPVETLVSLEIHIDDIRYGATPEAVKECPDLTESDIYYILLHGATTHIGCNGVRYFKPESSGDGVFYTVIRCYVSHKPTKGRPLYDLTTGAVADGYSSKCGCPPNSIEVDGCLCDIKEEPDTESSTITTFSTPPIFAERVYPNKRIRDGFNTWASSGDISSSTDRVRPPLPAPAPPRPQRSPRTPRSAPALHKRPHYDTSYYGEPPAKRPAPSIRVGSGFKWNLQTLAAAADAVESGGKSPVSALNELGVRVAYSVLRQGGPAHCPSFHVAVTVADLRFSGWGHSKREARAAAARACLGALLARAGRVLPAPSPHQDFTSDVVGHTLSVSEFQCLEPKVKALPPPAPPAVPLAAPPPAPAPMDVANGKEVSADSASPASLFGAAAPGAAHKSPINVLYENYSGLAFTCTFGDGSPLSETQAPLQLSHSMRFKVVCQIKEHKFEGYGSSKKLAKLAAARSALAALEDTRRDSPPCAPPAGALHQTLADHIGKLVNEKFNELMKNDLVHSKRKVLAGIVITTHNRIEDARVIAVTTGTKCVSGEHMSVTGRAVNDCHAEVAARRCLQRHLYAQLLMYANQPDPSQPLEDSDVEPLAGGGYQLKASRAVHLYVSTAPCGDGRIFSPHEHHHTEPDKHPNRLARGQLRTKIESGEGTIPVKNCNNVLQTWDGVMQGERLLTMSCSDKVARWSVCGLQGALLSRLLRPVYLQSLVLGSLLHPHHMYRAICGRFEAYISSLPPPFHLQRPLLARAASTEARTPARAPSFSVCWCDTQQLPEVINATTGKLESGQPSLLCKQSMFARWHYLVKRLPLLPQDEEPGDTLPEMPDKPDSLLYNEAKQMCPTYQLAKQRLIDAFEKAKLGRWIKRPLEQDQFVCEVAHAAPDLLFA